MKIKRLRPRTWLALGAAGVVLLAFAGLVLTQREPNPPGSRSGSARPIELPRLEGEGTLRLADYRGKPVVVNFFASWCVPCRKELPAFASVAATKGDRVTFLGIAHQDNRQSALALMAETGVRYPAAYDPDGKVARDYHLLGMPTTLFISADGRVLETHTGPLSERQLAEALSRHFGV